MRVERTLVVAITGASGSVYGVRFLESILRHYDRIYTIVSDNARTVIRTEVGLYADADESLGTLSEKITLCSPNDLTAPPASGSVASEGMVIIPCSMGTAGRIASGVSSDLITRSADVCLKENRKLIMVVRETPFNLIHLRNLTRLAEAGAIILPASPAFYSHPKTVDDMVEFVVARAMQQLGLVHPSAPEWHGIEE